MVQLINSIEEAKKVEKRLYNDIIIKILLITQEKGLDKEMYDVISSLQDLRDEIW